MLQVARLAPDLLQQAADRVAGFLLEQINEDGGARDRAGNSDLYYTVFCLEGLIALRRELPADRVRGFLQGHGAGEDLDLVHLCCLARCWAALDEQPETEVAGRIGERIESLWDREGVYESFLAYGALQDLKRALPDASRLVEAVSALRLPDGSFADDPDIMVGTTPTTAAAVTMLQHLQQPPPEGAGDWLLARVRPQGGFCAAMAAPIPDVLSTATALHALAAMKVPLPPAVKDATLDFLDSLWTGQSFVGNWTDDEQDCEYTYYALLALGHLSLA